MKFCLQKLTVVKYAKIIFFILKENINNTMFHNIELLDTILEMLQNLTNF